MLDVSATGAAARVNAAAAPIPGIGRAVIAFGPCPRPELEAGWRATQQAIVRILKERRFADTTLLGFSAVDGSPVSLAELETSLAESVDADVLTVVLAGPNAPDIPGSVQLSESEILLPNRVGPLMKIRHDALQAAGQQGKTIFIIDTHRAGIVRDQMVQKGFLNFSDGPDGYVLTSTGSETLNCAIFCIPPETGEFVSYLRLLVDAIAKGSSIGDAHEQAADGLRRLQGPVVCAFPEPSPTLMSGALRDIFLGLTVYEGVSFFDLPDLNAPIILETSGNETLQEGEAPTLVVLAEDESTFDASEISVFAVITGPADDGTPPAQRVVDLPYDAQAERHRLRLDGFPTAQFGPNAVGGQYAVGLYAKDSSGNLSTVNSLTITTPPTSVRRWWQF